MYGEETIQDSLGSEKMPLHKLSVQFSILLLRMSNKFMEEATFVTLSNPSKTNQSAKCSPGDWDITMCWGPVTKMSSINPIKYPRFSLIIRKSCNSVLEASM